MDLNKYIKSFAKSLVHASFYIMPPIKFCPAPSDHRKELIESMTILDRFHAERLYRPTDTLNWLKKIQHSIYLKAIGPKEAGLVDWQIASQFFDPPGDSSVRRFEKMTGISGLSATYSTQHPLKANYLSHILWPYSAHNYIKSGLAPKSWEHDVHKEILKADQELFSLVTSIVASNLSLKNIEPLPIHRTSDDNGEQAYRKNMELLAGVIYGFPPDDIQIFLSGSRMREVFNSEASKRVDSLLKQRFGESAQIGWVPSPQTLSFIEAALLNPSRPQEPHHV